ncbi:HD domain-containing protein [Nocardia brasiliensis]|uniref:HD domain-containing protein n=1 Tax=Nocardia brasiliensis TaxID=37326 RepID=UPI002456F509|nr:HD domain-containing protein [Nocardia brasiliensis]
MMSVALERALTDRSDPPLRQLPREVEVLLASLDAPPRLAAHLRAVHDVACDLVDWVQRHYGSVQVDRAAVLIGAATHDIGKVVHLEELSGPGSAHEQVGYRLLVEHGFSEATARFARTHGTWHEPEVTFDDLMVSLADKIWKAKRASDLEQLVVQRIAAASGDQPWQVFMRLDDELDRIAADADRRLAFQTRYPVAT